MEDEFHVNDDFNVYMVECGVDNENAAMKA
jgi:hypothetical protein